MKKVINGTLFDTEKATEVASFQFSNPSDFNYLEETLYVTNKGNFILEGHGGAMTKYSKIVGNNSKSGGSDLELLLKDEAKQWLENHQNHFDEDIVKIFETYFPESLKEG